LDVAKRFAALGLSPLEVQITAIFGPCNLNDPRAKGNSCDPGVNKRKLIPVAMDAELLAAAKGQPAQALASNVNAGYGTVLQASASNVYTSNGTVM
jgi:hypothetical protein